MNVRSLAVVVACSLSMVSISGCSAELGEEEVAGAEEGQNADESSEALSGSFAVGTDLETTADLNHRSSPSPSADVLQVIPRGTVVKSAAATPRANWYGVTWNGKTGWVSGQYLKKPSAVSGSGAQRILSYHTSKQIELYDTTFGRNDGADALSNVRDAAAGRSAKQSCHGGAPCGRVALSTKLVSAMIALREKYGYRYFVTAIAGAAHSPGSFHYAGRAIDVGEINGRVISGDSAAARGFMQACRDLGGVEVLGPSNRSDHQDHIHCAF